MDVNWVEQTEADVPAGNGWLTSAEFVRLPAPVFPKRRADWRLGRWTAKNAVRIFLGHVPFDEIEIRAAPTGAPEVWIAGWRLALTISLSHRDGVACCAAAEGRGELGCDLESTERHSSAFISDYFTAGEQDWIARAGAAGRHELPSLLWSAKESTLKALCVGLREDTRSVVVQEQTPGEWPCPAEWSPLGVRHSGRDWHGWWRADDRFIRTLVADPAPHRPNEYRAGLSPREIFVEEQPL